MNRLPGDLPDRVASPDANHLVGGNDHTTSRDDSYASTEHSLDAPSRLGPIALDRLRGQLSARETAIIGSLADFRYLTAHQVEQLHFTDHASPATAARIRARVLARLTDAGILRRLERRIGGVRRGSSGYVYRLGPLGHRLHYLDATRSGRYSEPSVSFLDHTLAVAQLAIDLHTHARHSRDELEIITQETEPDCWRRFQRGLGGTEVLKPDLFVAVGVGDYELRWFIEIDRGTESTTAVVKKCQLYLDYQRTGIEQAAHDVYPKVMWVATTARRAAQLDKAIGNAGALRGSEVFTITTADRALDQLRGGDQ